MSKYYKNSNNESTIDLYRKSLIYDADIKEPEYGNLKDFQYAEKYLYGRVARNYVPIELEPNITLGNLQQSNNNASSGYQVLRFVQRAFDDLSMQFRKKVMSGQLNPDDPFLSTLEVQKAYQSPRTLFTAYNTTIKQGIVEAFRMSELRFENFSQFVGHLRSIMSTQARALPYTYPAFVKSRYCPMRVSGLVIEIAKSSAANDDQKIQQFKESKNWQFYLNACRSYGFSVDTANPWRLIADIGSPEMIQYARMDNYLSTDSVLAMAYTPAHRTYYENFEDILLSLYNAAKRDYISVEYCADGTTRNEMTRPAEYSLDSLRATFSKSEFLKLYMEIRLLEEGEVTLSEHEQGQLSRDILQLAHQDDYQNAVDTFESLIAETFDSSGSLTDRFKRAMMSSE